MGGKLYAVGGHDGNQHLNSVECYDPKASKWEYVQPMKTLRRGIAVGVLGGPMYAVGEWCISIIYERGRQREREGRRGGLYLAPSFEFGSLACLSGNYSCAPQILMTASSVLSRYLWKNATHVQYIPVSRKSMSKFGE